MSTTSGGAGSGSGVMMSNLPLVFCKGLPSNIDSLSAKEVQNFLVFLMRCVHNVNPIQWSRMNRPTWWSPEVPLSPIVLSKRFRTSEWQAKIRAMIIACYIHYDAVFLLQFSGQLAESVKEGFRMGDNSDGTTSLYDRSSGKLLVTFRNENKDYDAAPVKNEEKGKPASSKRPQLMPLTPKEREPPKEVPDTSDKMVERPTTDIYLCDHCGAEFPTLSAIRVHEDQCIIGKEAKGEKVIQNDIQELKDIDQNKYLWYLGLVSATDKVRPSNVTPAKQYPVPKRAASVQVRKTAGVPFSSNLGRQLFNNGQVSGKESLRRYEDHCHTSDPYLATPTTNYPTYSVTFRRPGPKNSVPWVHTYSFNVKQRREQLKRIDTGLTKESRQLLRECKKSRVTLKRLDQKEIEEWTRPKPKPLPTPSLNRLPVLSMPFNNRPRFPPSGTSAPPLIAPVPSHRLRGPPPLVPINQAAFRQMYRPTGIVNSAPYTIQNGIIRFNNPTPANLAYRTPPPMPRPTRPTPLPTGRPEPSLQPVVVDLCSSDEEQTPAPPKSTTSDKDKPAPRKPAEISVVPLKNLLEPQVILQEPNNYFRFRNMPMVPTQPKQNSTPSQPAALAPKPRPQLTPIAPRPQLVPSRMPVRPPIQLKPNFIPAASSILGGVGMANPPLSFPGTAPRTVVARAPTVNLATGAHTVPISSAQLANLGREIVITSASKETPPPKVAPLNLGNMPAEKKEAMNEALRKLHQHAFPRKQPIQIKFSNKPTTVIGKDFATGSCSTVAKKAVAVSPVVSKPAPVTQVQTIVQNPESDQADKAKVPTTPQPSPSNVTPTVNANDKTDATPDDERICDKEVESSSKLEEAKNASKSDDSLGSSSEISEKEEEPKVAEVKEKELDEKERNKEESTPKRGIVGKKDEETVNQDGKNKTGEEFGTSSLSKRGRGKDVEVEEANRGITGKSSEPIVELPETIAGISAQAVRAKRDTVSLFRDECKELRQHGLVDILSSTERVTRRRTLAAVTPETAAPPKKKRKRSLPSESSESPRPASKSGVVGEPEMAALVDGDADRDENSNKEAKIDWLKDGETSRGSWTPVSSKDDQSRVSTPSSSVSPGPDSEARRRMKRELQLLQGDECKELAVKGLHTLAQTTGRVLRRSMKQLPSS